MERRRVAGSTRWPDFDADFVRLAKDRRWSRSTPSPESARRAGPSERDSMRDRFLCSIRLRAAARVLALVPLTAAAAILLASAEPTLPVMERIYPLAPQEGVFAYARI